MLTVVTSLGQQNRNVFAFLVEACRARVENTAPPSLLPTEQLDQAVKSAA